MKWNFLEEVEVEFESKFSDVNEHKEIFNFIESSFIVDVSSLTPAITQLCPDNRAALDDILHVELRADVGHFWSLVSEADFPNLKPLTQKRGGAIEGRFYGDQVGGSKTMPVHLLGFSSTYFLLSQCHLQTSSTDIPT